MGPDIAERGYGLFDYHTSMVLDAENGVSGNLPDARGGNSMLPRNFQNSIERRRRNGDYRAGAAFSEDGRIPQASGSSIMICAPKSARSETTFRYRDGQPAVTDVVRRLNLRGGRQCDKALL